MFFLTISNVWNFSFFFPLTYIIFLVSLTLYLLPLFYNSNMKNTFFIVSFIESYSIIFLPCISILLIFNFWSSFAVSSWFGHLVYTSFQYKFSIFIIFTFLLFTFLYSSVSYLSSREIFDFLITQFNFLYWVLLLFHANSFFTIIFIIEVLSTLIFLLMLTSVFTSCFFYRNLDFSSHSFFESSTPYTFVQSILYFFWVSLLASLNLFLFIIFLYDKIFTFDWYLIEHIFFYFVSISSYKDIYTLGITWFIILFSIFLKCGIAPFYLWKPTFFKGMSFTSISFYISFFYFFLFLFIIQFLSSYCHELFYFFSFFSLLIIFMGIIMLFFILCETFFVKTFFAVSSILNSLLVFLCISVPHTFDFMFFI
jgi:hypothetical protein